MNPIQAQSVTLAIIGGEVYGRTRQMPETTLPYRWAIPTDSRGLRMQTLNEMSDTLHMSMFELAFMLDSIGVRGQDVTSLAEIYSSASRNRRANKKKNRGPRTAPTSAPAAEEKCCICLESSAATPQMEWATAAGCDRHRFHSQCLSRCTQGSCPLCRAAWK
jgi:hypothetical protein